MARVNLSQKYRDHPELKKHFINAKAVVGSTLGVGAFGTVVELQLGGTKCAGKKIHDVLLGDDVHGTRMSGIIAKFVEECHLMAEAKHPNVVQFMGICILDGSEHPVLVMERMDMSLDYFLELRKGHIPFSLKIRNLLDIARGLVYLHTRYPVIIHRDLTSRNVLLNRASLQAKIADLGNALMIDHNRLMNTLSQMPGTPLYMPPEAASTKATYDTSLDMFSFGHLALYVATDTFPCEILPHTYTDPVTEKVIGYSEVERRQSYIDMLYANEELGADHPLCNIIKTCLHNLPSKRPKASQVMEVLEELVSVHEDPYSTLDSACKLDLIQLANQNSGDSLNARASAFTSSSDYQHARQLKLKAGAVGVMDIYKSAGIWKLGAMEWRQYVFQITKTQTLRYSRSSKREKTIGELDLGSVTSVSVFQHNDCRTDRFAFQVSFVEGSKKSIPPSPWLLSTDTMEERSSWMEAIKPGSSPAAASSGDHVVYDVVQDEQPATTTKPFSIEKSTNQDLKDSVGVCKAASLESFSDSLEASSASGNSYEYLPDLDGFTPGKSQTLPIFNSSSRLQDTSQRPHALSGDLKIGGSISGKGAMYVSLSTNSDSQDSDSNEHIYDLPPSQEDSHMNLYEDLDIGMVQSPLRPLPSLPPAPQPHACPPKPRPLACTPVPQPLPCPPIPKPHARPPMPIPRSKSASSRETKVDSNADMVRQQVQTPTNSNPAELLQKLVEVLAIGGVAHQSTPHNTRDVSAQSSRSLGSHSLSSPVLVGGSIGGGDSPRRRPRYENYSTPSPKPPIPRPRSLKSRSSLEYDLRSPVSNPTSPVAAQTLPSTIAKDIIVPTVENGGKRSIRYEEIIIGTTTGASRTSMMNEQGTSSVQNQSSRKMLVVDNEDDEDVYTPRPDWAKAKTAAVVKEDDSLYLMRRQALFIPRPKIQTLERIGKGQYGEVFKGLYTRGSGSISVAVKTIRKYTSEKDADEFLREMAVMSQLVHPNVIKLYGLVQQDSPWIIVEYLPHGDLRNFLKRNERPVKSLVKYMLDVSMGMHYIAEKGLVHRDVAARNIIVGVDHSGNSEVCKVSDFGLLRELPKDDSIYISTQKTPVPIRWMAPESLKRREFSPATDVWSFGVLQWELSNIGKMPYKNFPDNFQCALQVTQGYRLDIPQSYPEIVQKIMKACWQTEPIKRPSFLLISNLLSDEVDF